MVAGSHINICKGCSIVSHICSYCFFICVGKCVNCLSVLGEWWVRRLCALSYSTGEEPRQLSLCVCALYIYWLR